MLTEAKLRFQWQAVFCETQSFMSAVPAVVTLQEAYTLACSELAVSSVARVQTISVSFRLLSKGALQNLTVCYLSVPPGPWTRNDRS